jgi:branched-chain amino acid transport system substrate-binding protein
MKHRFARALVVVVALAVVTTACGSSDGGSSGTEDTTSKRNDAGVLGEKDVAKGEPVKVGLVSNGVTSTINNKIELDVADATVKWLNERKGGIGGRPIELVTCTDGADPARASDCANQLIAKDVAAVVIGSSAVIEAEWQGLHDAHIPVVAFGASGKLVKDGASTFAVGSPPSSLTVVPAAAARKEHAKRITAMVIDVPAATQNYEAVKPALAKEGITLDLVRIPIGTPDMTPQAQQIVGKGDPGVLNVLGNDTFCIAAFNALQAVGFKGTLTTAAPCITDATRTAVSGDFLKGAQLSYAAPVGDDSNESSTLYEAVTDTYADTRVDLSRTQGWGMFIALNGLATGVEGIAGDVTPASIIAAMRGMSWKKLPGSGGLHFRCNSKADPANPAVCVTGVLVSRLDAGGKPTTYEVVNDTEIPD